MENNETGARSLIGLENEPRELAQANIINLHKEKKSLAKRNLLRLGDLTVDEIMEIIIRSEEIKKYGAPKLENKVVANLFFEPSTRTHNSFIMAEKKLGISEINLIPEHSSVKKGESLYDTAKTFESIGVDALVMRDKEECYYNNFFGKLNIPILNGGDGSGDHPTQSLLDLLTIKEEFGSFQGLKILLIGDIKHSRVANSNIAVMRRLGMVVCLCAPEEFKKGEEGYCSIDGVLPDMDIVMLLRVQHERHDHTLEMDADEYNRLYGLNEERVARMKDNAIIMHPAPFNRGWEIHSDVVECKKSRIFKQMENGVYVRMAVLERALS